MIQNLENIFDEFDKIAKSDTLLYDPKFDMAIVNSNKTFDIFFVRFTLAIVLLDFSNRHKISNLWQTLSEQSWF